MRPVLVYLFRDHRVHFFQNISRFTHSFHRNMRIGITRTYKYGSSLKIAVIPFPVDPVSKEASGEGHNSAKSGGIPCSKLQGEAGALRKTQEVDPFSINSLSRNGVHQIFEDR